MLMMPRAVVLGTAMCNGLSIPSSIGPTVTPSPTAFTRLKRDIGGIEIGEDQQVGRTRQGGSRAKRIAADLLDQGGIGMHFAIHLQLRLPRTDQLQRLAHFARRWRVASRRNWNARARPLSA